MHSGYAGMKFLLLVLPFVLQIDHCKEISIGLITISLSTISRLKLSYSYKLCINILISIPNGLNCSNLLFCSRFFPYDEYTR